MRKVCTVTQFRLGEGGEGGGGGGIPLGGGGGVGEPRTGIIYIYIYTHMHTCVRIHTHVYVYIYTYARIHNALKISEGWVAEMGLWCPWLHLGELVTTEASVNVRLQAGVLSGCLRALL